MVHHISNEFIFFIIFVVSLFSITYTNGTNNNYIKMFPKIGENVTLKCVNNSMKNLVFWKMNHKEYPGRAKVMENGDLFISSFNLTDSGIYTCDLTSAYNYIEHAPLIKFELIPKSVPKFLTEYVTVRPNTVLMLITWKEIDNNDGSPITNITIRYRVMDDRISNDNWNVLQVDPSKNQKEIYSLRKNTYYQIQIWASNEIGDSNKIELNVKTLNDMTETELEKQLLEGIDTFDTRAWTFAVIVIMSTFSIFGIALFCLFIKDPRMQKRLEDNDDVERIELIPNITINPGYCEA